MKVLAIVFLLILSVPNFAQASTPSDECLDYLGLSLDDYNGFSEAQQQAVMSQCDYLDENGYDNDDEYESTDDYSTEEETETEDETEATVTDSSTVETATFTTEVKAEDLMPRHDYLMAEQQQLLQKLNPMGGFNGCPFAPSEDMANLRSAALNTLQAMKDAEASCSITSSAISNLESNLETLDELEAGDSDQEAVNNAAREAALNELNSLLGTLAQNPDCLKQVGIQAVSSLSRLATKVITAYTGNEVASSILSIGADLIQSIFNGFEALFNSGAGLQEMIKEQNNETILCSYFILESYRCTLTPEQDSSQLPNNPPADCESCNKAQMVLLEDNYVDFLGQMVGKIDEASKQDDFFSNPVESLALDGQFNGSVARIADYLSRKGHPQEALKLQGFLNDLKTTTLPVGHVEQPGQPGLTQADKTAAAAKVGAFLRGVDGLADIQPGQPLPAKDFEFNGSPFGQIVSTFIDEVQKNSNVEAIRDQYEATAILRQNYQQEMQLGRIKNKIAMVQDLFKREDQRFHKTLMNNFIGEARDDFDQRVVEELDNSFKDFKSTGDISSLRHAAMYCGLLPGFMYRTTEMGDSSYRTGGKTKKFRDMCSKLSDNCGIGFPGSGRDIPQGELLEKQCHNMKTIDQKVMQMQSDFERNRRFCGSLTQSDF